MVKGSTPMWTVSTTHGSPDRSPFSKRESKDDMDVSLGREAPPKPPRSGRVFSVTLPNATKKSDLGIHLGAYLFG